MTAAETLRTAAFAIRADVGRTTSPLVRTGAAMAVADLLDTFATIEDEGRDLDPTATAIQARAIASAYLGENLPHLEGCNTTRCAARCPVRGNRRDVRSQQIKLTNDERLAISFALDDYYDSYDAESVFRCVRRIIAERGAA